MRVPPLLAVALLALPLVASAVAPDPDTELPDSPRLLTGRLDNGVRYAVMRHTAQPGQISLRLLVATGSLQEREDERGFAHFVEHMTFNGTRNYRAGELVKALQREGVAFGPHLNAHTFADRTVYQLDLSGRPDEQLATGLRVFHDFADGIRFDPAEVKRERGVILSEDLVRQTPQSALQNARTALLYAGTRFPERLPIGTEATIRAAAPQNLRAFYDAWYRPERLTLIVVGDIDPAGALAQLRGEFASLAPRAAARPEPTVGELPPHSASPIGLHPTTLRTNLEFQFCLVRPRPPGRRFWRDAYRSTHIQAAATLFARRLAQLERTDPPLFAGTQVSPAAPYRGWREVTVAVCTRGGDWEPAVARTEQEMRRVLEHGFTSDELAQYKQDAREGLARSVAALGTNTPAALADDILDSLREDEQFTISAEERAQFEAIIDAMTVEDCQRVFREVLGHGPPAIFVSGPASALPSPERVAQALATSSAVAVAPPAGQAAVQFGYNDFGPPGTVVRREHVAALDVELVEFSNGARLAVKRTPYETNFVHCQLRLPGGGQAEPANLPGARLWTVDWLFGGLGRHSFDEVARLAQENQLAFGCRSDDRAFVLGAASRGGKLELTLGLLAAYASDPAFRPAGREAAATALLSQLRPVWISARGPVQQIILPRLAGGDPRVGLPASEVVFARTHDEVKKWLAPLVASGRPGLTVVGDVEPETVVALAARTLGALPARAAPVATEAPAPKFPQAPVAEIINFLGNDLRPASVEAYWAVHEPLTARLRQQFRQLAAVIEDRIRVQIREKRGATYTGTAGFDEAPIMPGFAYLHASFEVKPAEAVRFGDRIRDLAADLARHGVTAEELARVQAQAKATIQNQRATNEYWLDTIAAAQADPTLLAAAQTLDADIAAVTTADLDALAARYLRPELALRFLIMPKPESKPAAPPAKH
jgi:zinc protease